MLSVGELFLRETFESGVVAFINHFMRFEESCNRHCRFALLNDSQSHSFHGLHLLECGLWFHDISIHVSHELAFLVVFLRLANCGSSD